MDGQEKVLEPPEPELETDLEVESIEDECEGEPSALPWLLPVLAIAAFFAFVALLVLFIL